MADCIFHPSESLNFETVQSDTIRITNLIKQNPNVNCLRVNLSNVKHCDSTGLALLIEAKRLCKKHNMQFLIENMNETVDSLSKFCGVDAVINN